MFLKRNSPAYADIIISEDNLKYYKEHGMDEVPNMTYVYDPSSKDTLEDEFMPISEKDHVYEDNLGKKSFILESYDSYIVNLILMWIQLSVPTFEVNLQKLN